MGQTRVFVVDDEPAFVRLATLVLSQRFGYDVLAETDPVKAVARIKVECPDVILLDLAMPRQDGFETLKFLLADEKTREIPVIVLTSYDADRFRVMAERWGADAFLGKKAVDLAAFVDLEKESEALLVAKKVDLDYSILDQAIQKAIARRAKNP